MKADYLHNPGNNSLSHAGGISVEIAAAAGEDYLKECQAYIAKEGKLRKSAFVPIKPFNLVKNFPRGILNSALPF